MDDAELAGSDAMQAETLSTIAGVRHGFFSRRGGVSSGIYGTLNCGIGSNDSSEHVITNRQRVAAALLAQDGLVRNGVDVLTAYQVHSARAVRVTEMWADADRPQVDGLVTTERGLVLGVLSADCGPVLFADDTNGVIGAAHAGWQGAIGGVVAATIAEMEAAGAKRDCIHAAVGPCIAQRSYEVGDEFKAQFLAQDAASERFFAVPDGKSKPHFDLAGFIVSRLAVLDLASVTDLATCTYDDPARYFSFRRATHREEADYGRQISAIVLT